MSRFFRGLLAGAIATAPMTLAMQILHRWPRPEREALPPQQITSRIAARVGAKPHLDKPQIQALTLANHFGFGAAIGGLFALFSPKFAAPAIVKGGVWGLLVWALSYGGWLPAAHILPPASRQSRRRNGVMITAHLVWGIATALLAEKLSPPET